MSTENAITLSAALLAFGASLVTVGVALYIARFSRFAREQWWDRKADAYSRIIDELAKMIEYFGQIYDAEISGRDLPENRKQEIEKDWNRSNGEVQRATNMGAFMISDEAEAILRKLGRELDGFDPNTWLEWFDHALVETREALRELVEIAKRDLRVHRT